MIFPKYLKKGNKIGVTATSSGNGDELHIRKLENAIKQFKERGYNIIETPNVRTNNKGRSSSKEKRAEEFMALIRDKEIKTIITARGGDFLLEILPLINFNEIKQNPKWVQGYSDTTGLIFCITTICDIATIYANNFAEFSMEPWHTSLENNLALLEGKEKKQKSFCKYQDGWQEEITGKEEYNLTKAVKWKNARLEKKIILQGRLIGGCIDILISLVGTKYDNVENFCEKYKEDGIIWFFDNCELSSESILRALWQLKEANWFKYSKGIIFGRNITRKSYYEISFEDAVMTVLDELNIPIIFDVDIGHVMPQMTFINGAIVNLESENGKGMVILKK